MKIGNIEIKNLTGNELFEAQEFPNGKIVLVYNNITVCGIKDSRTREGVITLYKNKIVASGNLVLTIFVHINVVALNNVEVILKKKARDISDIKLNYYLHDDVKLSGTYPEDFLQANFYAYGNSILDVGNSHYTTNSHTDIHMYDSSTLHVFAPATIYLYDNSEASSVDNYYIHLETYNNSKARVQFAKSIVTKDKSKVYVTKGDWVGNVYTNITVFDESELTLYSFGKVSVCGNATVNVPDYADVEVTSGNPTINKFNPNKYL